MIDEARDDLTPPSSASYFVRHWRGELSLPRSYWLNGALIFGLGCNILWLAAFSATMIVFRETPPVAIIIGLVLIGLHIGAYIWALVGTWRSARNYRGPRFWSILARIMISLGVIISISHLTQTLTVFSHL